MPIPASAAPAAPAADDDLEAARFRARMERVSPGMAGRRSRRPRDDEDEEEQGGGFRLGWFGWLVIDAVVILGTVAVVLAWPPIESCRAQEKAVGFYAGETVGQCIRRGIGQRINNADQHIKIMLRGSGH